MLVNEMKDRVIFSATEEECREALEEARDLGFTENEVAEWLREKAIRGNEYLKKSFLNKDERELEREEADISAELLMLVNRKPLEEGEILEFKENQIRFEKPFVNKNNQLCFGWKVETEDIINKGLRMVSGIVWGDISVENFRKAAEDILNKDVPNVKIAQAVFYQKGGFIQMVNGYTKLISGKSLAMKAEKEKAEEIYMNELANIEL